jgi:hypothetical protein
MKRDHEENPNPTEKPITTITKQIDTSMVPFNLAQFCDRALHDGSMNSLHVNELIISKNSRLVNMLVALGIFEKDSILHNCFDYGECAGFRGLILQHDGCDYLLEDGVPVVAFLFRLAYNVGGTWQRIHKSFLSSGFQELDDTRKQILKDCGADFESGQETLMLLNPDLLWKTPICFRDTMVTVGDGMFCYVPTQLETHIPVAIHENGNVNFKRYDTRYTFQTNNCYTAEEICKREVRLEKATPKKLDKIYEKPPANRSIAMKEPKSKDMQIPDGGDGKHTVRVTEYF